jgi:hypothetical protein
LLPHVQSLQGNGAACYGAAREDDHRRLDASGYEELLIDRDGA